MGHLQQLEKGNWRHIPQHRCSLHCCQVNKMLSVWKRTAEHLGIPQDFLLWLPRNCAYS